MRIFLDDERQPPDNTWLRLNWPTEVIEYLKTGKVTELSLDHDLGDIFQVPERTGYDVVLWMEEAVNTTDFIPPKIKIHSANPVAWTKMLAGINKIWETAKGQGKIK